MNGKRICTIDIIKFFLSIIIVLHHYQQVTNLTFGRWNFYGGAIYFGYAVEFFFIISGFLSAYCLKNERTPDFKQFILKKAIRIYPMAVISVLATVILMFIYKLYIGQWFLDIKPGLWKVFNSILLTHTGGVIPNLGLAINNPTWYLCILMACYILFWQIIWLCDRLRVNPLYWFAAMSMIGIGLTKYGINLPYLNSYSGRGYAAFFFGIIMWYAYQNINPKKLISISIVELTVLGTIIGTKMYDLYDDQWGIATFMIFPSLFWIVLFLDRFFKRRVWKVLGEISFEIYLWHFPLLILWSFVPGYNLHNGRMMMLEFTALTILAAIVLYYFIEIPITNLLRKKYKI